MKALNFILLKVLFFLLSITVLNSQAQNKFKFTNHIDKRETTVTVMEVSDPDGGDLLTVDTLTRPDNGGGVISRKWQAAVNPDGFWSLSDVEHERESLYFSVLTRSLLVENSRPGGVVPLHVLLPFVYVNDEAVSVRAEFSHVEINNAPNNQDNSAFNLRGYLTVARQTGLQLGAPASVFATVEVAFNPDNDQLTWFSISTAAREGVHFTGELLSSDSSEQGADGQDEQSVVNDPETTDGDPNEGDSEDKASVESDPESRPAAEDYKDEKGTEDKQPVASDSESEAPDDDQDERGTDDEQPVASDSESEAPAGGRDERGTDDEQTVASDSESEAPAGGQDERGTDDEQPTASDSESKAPAGGQDERGTDDEQPASSDSESEATDDDQDEDAMKDNQPNGSRTLPINIPRVDQNHAGGLPTRTPADQLDSRAGVLGSVSPGAEGVGHTKVE